MTQPSGSAEATSPGPWIRRRTSPSTSEIIREAAIGVAAGVIGTGAATYLAGRVGDALVIMVAGVLWLVAYALMYRLIFGRMPALLGRPGQYSVPSALALIAVAFVMLAETIPIAVAFPVAVGILLIGNALSDYQWSRGVRRSP